MTNERPNPDSLLSRIKHDELKEQRGRLKVFLGAVAGVGKTYAMLLAARKLKEQGIDVVIGYVETHGRRETEALLDGLESLPLRTVEHKGTVLKELDIDAVLKRKPQVVLVDELAHTNALDSRHTKRWQDVQELLDAGIDVFTALNVQHVESLFDVVAQITRVSIRERVPDSFLEKADTFELVDLPPAELIERLKEGKVYLPDQARNAIENFFREGNLMALRELALRFTADRVVADIEEYRNSHDIKHPWPASECILVCVSPSPLAARLVRAGKRLSEALHAKWIVIYVESPQRGPLSEKEKLSLIQTLRLAEQFGAETLELSASDIPEEIVRCARQYNVSKIVIGKPARPRWKELLAGSVVEEVIRRSGAIDVHVITGDEGSNPPLLSGFRRTSKKSGYFWSVVTVIICTLVAQAMLPFFEPSNVVMAYLLGVVIVAVRFSRGPSILASVLCVASFDFFCVPPFYTFAVTDTQYLVTFLLMLIVALIISTLTMTIKQQAHAARLREMRTAALYSMSRELSSTLDVEDLVTIGLRHIGTVFDTRSAVYVVNKEGRLDLVAKGEGKYELANVSTGVLGWVHQNKQPAGLGTNTLPGTGELYLPLLGAEKNIGVLAICPVTDEQFLPPDQMRLLETFANQIALACERARLSEESESARWQVETEQLKNSLLSSVSHDLRTPLATISGAASTILESTAALDIESCKELVTEIYSESIRLNTLVNNLLDMSKLESGSLQITRDLQPVDDVIGTALSYMEQRLAKFTIVTRVPSDLPLIEVDATLIQQLLVNLLENAMKYAPDGKDIEITAERQLDQVCISIADGGPGIKDQNKTRVFEKFFRSDLNSVHGAGLGLAICSAIVRVHGGRIWVEDRPGGGAVFKFLLPSAEEPIGAIEAEQRAEVHLK